jgi:crotonobetaine/carnitine-CoA ligase
MDLSKDRATVAAKSHLPAQYAPAERTLPVILERQAQRCGSRPLFKTGSTTWTVAEARDIAARSAGSLAFYGIKLGDRVALMCGNRAEFMQIYLGCAWLGAIAVPINTASKGPQLRHILNNSGARLLVIEGALCPALTTLALTDLALESVWIIGADSPSAAIDRPSCALPPLADAAPPGAVRPGDTVAILYTSGTTGPAKGVCCPQAQYFWWGANTGMLLELQDNDVMVTTLPLFHTNALNAFYQALLHGAQLVAEPRFSASGFWESLVAHGATVTFVLGAMVPILLSKPPSALDRAHTTRVALAPGVPGHLQQPFTERFGIALVDGFGSTETNFVIGDTKDRQKPGWMGPVYHGFQACVVDEDDNELPRGEAGELLLRADEPFAFATGYFGMAEKTVEAWRNLWFHTGDRAIHETDGTFKFVDRLKDAIRRRGENISSFEVEQVLLSHPSVATAAAFPVRSELAEDEVMVALVLRDGHSLAPEALMAFCQDRMAYFAVPRYVAFVDELPATENGKIQKYKLRERGIIPGTWDREAAGYRLVR